MSGDIETNPGPVSEWTLRPSVLETEIYSHVLPFTELARDMMLFCMGLCLGYLIVGSSVLFYWGNFRTSGLMLDVKKFRCLRLVVMRIEPRNLNLA